MGPSLMTTRRLPQIPGSIQIPGVGDAHAQAPPPRTLDARARADSVDRAKPSKLVPLLHGFEEGGRGCHAYRKRCTPRAQGQAQQRQHRNSSSKLLETKREVIIVVIIIIIDA